VNWFLFVGRICVYLDLLYSNRNRNSGTVLATQYALNKVKLNKLST